MGLGLEGGTLPRELFGESTPRHSECGDERRRVGEPRHGGPERLDLSMRDEEPRLPVPYRLANARGVGAEDGCSARGGLEIRDPPPFLWRGQDERPGPSQQRQLLLLADAPKKPHASPEVKRG